MKTQIIIAIIFMSALASAHYSGETISYNLTSEFYNITSFEVYGNNSFVNISIHGTIANIKVPNTFSGRMYVTFYGYAYQDNYTQFVDRIVYRDSSSTIYRNVTISPNCSSPPITIEEEKPKFNWLYIWIPLAALLTIALIYLLARRHKKIKEEEKKEK